jgi:hypothetical protein
MTPERPPPDGGIPDERLMMFADGILDEAEAAEISRAIETDPTIEARLHAFLATRHGLKGAFAHTMNKRPPDRLLATIMRIDPVSSIIPAPAKEENVIPFQAKRDAKAPPVRPAWIPLALAASVAAVAFGLGGYFAGQSGSSPSTALAALTGPIVVERIASLRDGERTDFGHGLRGSISGSYQLADRRFCRTLAVEQVSSATAAEGVACLGPQGWRVELALPRSTDGPAYRPAAGAGPIDALLEAGGAEAALSAAEVDALIRRAWK